MDRSNSLGIQLAVPSASKVTQKIVEAAQEKFPSVFEKLKISENPKIFSRNYDTFLTEFEITRALSPQRVEIAQFVLNQLFQQCTFIQDDKLVPLPEIFTSPSPLPLKTIEYTYVKPFRGTSPEVSYGGRIYRSKGELQALGNFLAKEGIMSEEANKAFLWSISHLFSKDEEGRVDLRGEKFALLGGTAELSPLIYLLRAGAEVFTTSRHSSLEKILHRAGEFSGKLVYCEEGADLLTQPAQIAATISSFAQGQSVHVGSFAYAGGKGKELRLAIAMNAITEAASEVVASIIFYPSPTIIAEVSEQMAQRAIEGISKRSKPWPLLMRACSRGAWYCPNIVTRENRFWTRSFGTFQGCSYAASNLFGKYYAAEVYHEKGLPKKEKVNVSINVAPITETLSLNTPTVRAAFREAKRMGIDVWKPYSTRQMMQHLFFHDLKNPQAPGNSLSSKKKSLFSQQVHSGAFSVPWKLNGIIEEAAITGNIRRWTLGQIQEKPDFAAVAQNSPEEDKTAWFIVPRDSAHFEKWVQCLSGSLAQVISGGKKSRASSSLYLGKASVVPPSGQKLFRLINFCNLIFPASSFPLRAWAKGQKIHGSLLSSLLWEQKKPSDLLGMQVNSEGNLQRVRIFRENEQDLEWMVSNSDPQKIEQILHFARTIDDGSKELKVAYTYNKKQGVLTSVGPTEIKGDVFLDRPSIDLPDQQITLERRAQFEKLVSQKAQNSITFPANAGFLRDLLAQLMDPQLKVDFSRLTVYSLHFSGSPFWDYQKEITLSGKAGRFLVTKKRKGEILEAVLNIFPQQEQNKENEHSVRIGVFIRGNESPEDTSEIPRISFQSLAQTEKGGSIPLSLMEPFELIEFAQLNGDYNPLHQIDGVATAVGFRSIINPGFGIIAEIEGAVRQNWPEKKINDLQAIFIRPGYPSKKYHLQWKLDSNNSYLYQLIDEKNKVLVDGSFSFVTSEK